MGLGDADAAKQILEGTFECPEEMDEGSKIFIKNMKARWDALKQTASVLVAAEDFKNCWKKAKESTSSSMSGLHFGHHKSATKNDCVSEVHAMSMHIMLNAGFSPDRWQKGLTAMIEKKPGVILVDKLRAILLMEADFNFGNKMTFGSRAMKNAEVSDVFRHEIYGSRKNVEASEAAMVRCMFLDKLRQMRRDGAIASVDAHTCYDRIVHSVASLCFQRMGAPAEAIKTMFTTMCNMRF